MQKKSEKFRLIVTELVQSIEGIWECVVGSPVSAQHYVQTYSTILRFGVRWALFAFHIQVQNRSQHVAPLNEELLRKQSEDSVNGECWSEGKKSFLPWEVNEVNRFKGF